MKTPLLSLAVLGLLAALSHAAPPGQSAPLAAAGSAALVRPYEINGGLDTVDPIDTRVLAALKKKKIQPAALCSDEVFLRRVYLDVIGTLPEPIEVRGFLKSKDPNKRAALIDALLEREEFAEYWSMKWCDLLRVKAEFPINLWPNAVQAYHRWIYDSIRENRPYDEFARALLTSSGSNFRVPPVNFYRAIQGRDSSSIAAAVALTFMGTRLDKWPADQRAALEPFFSRVAYKKTAEWKEEIILLDPASTSTLRLVFPDGATVLVPPDQDPRQVFADWLIRPENPWFTRAIVNRAWSWFLGRGVIHEPDDIRPDNPPSNPELLVRLEKELVDSKYDLKQLFRAILNSRTYQQSSIPRSDNPEAEALFAYYPARRLDAEVILDALHRIGGAGENYSSPIPEPFTFIPQSHRTIELADGSITSSYLEMFGRPARDTGLESERNNNPTDAQRLYLLNSNDIQRRIAASPTLRQLADKARKDPTDLIRSVYEMFLSRYPTAEELSTAKQYFQTGKKQPRQAAEDLVWALINSKEFLFRH